MANRQTSDRVSSKAAFVLALDDPFEDNDALADLIEKIVADPAGQGARDALHEHFDDWVKNARILAGSALSQDETKGKRVIGKHPALAAPYEGSAGTDAYEMVAAAEQRNVEVTDTLMAMIAATVLSVLIDEEGGGRSNVTFSPALMDSMHQRYEMEAKRDGLLTTVSITPRAGAFPPLALQAEQGIDDEEPKPQAVHVDHDRPVWAIRYYDRSEKAYLAKMHDQGDAQRHLADYNGPYDLPEPTIENRFCLHHDCPTERCNHVPDGDDATEVTSDS